MMLFSMAIRAHGVDGVCKMSVDTKVLALNRTQKKRIMKMIVYMKATLLAVLISCFQLYAAVFAQPITLKVERMALTEVFQQIRKQSQMDFIIKSKQMARSRLVTVEVKNVPLEEALKLVFEGQPFDYVVESNTIIVKDKLVKRVPDAQLVQEAVARGRVVSNGGQPIAGVSVLEKGTSNGTVSNADGVFSLSLKGGSQAVLEFKSIGYLTRELPAGNQMSVRLMEDISGLEEVVVVGYGVQKKETLTGAITTIRTGDVLQSSAANITNALTGRLPGLTTIQSSGRPGFDEARLLIRGQSTWVNSSPLIIIDGIERENFSQIDPNEVETISILKDASSTAVYGVRGANGVVLITTKRGQTGKPQVSLTHNSSMQRPSRIPELLGSYEHIQLLNEALVNDGMQPRFSEAEVIGFRDSSGTANYPDVNFWDEFTKPFSLQNQTNLNIRGGTQKIKYFTSVGYLKQGGMFRYTDENEDFDTNTDFSRLNYRSNLDIKINQYQELSANLSARIETRKGFGTNYGTNFLNSLHQLFQGINSTPPYVFNIFNPDGSIGGAQSFANPYRSIAYSGFNTDRINAYDIIVKLNNRLDFLTKGLSAVLNVSTNSNFGTNKAYSQNRASYQYLPATGGYNQLTEDAPLTYVAEELNTVGYRLINLQAQINYAREFGDHGVTAMALYNQQKEEREDQIPFALMGVSSRATYAYKSRYFAEVNMGYNGSENFAPGNRFGLFPAYSAGWNISEEPFLKNKVSFLDFMKIRGSYGVVGNDRIGGARFLYQSMYGIVGGTQTQFYSFGSSNPTSLGGIVESRQGNPDLRWETATKRNLGFEAKFFKNKLSIVADIFDEQRKDILMEARSFPLVQGGPVPTINIGRVNNKGYELELEHNNNIGQDWGYSVRGTVSFARNVVVNRDDPGQTPEHQKLAGYRINQFRGLTVLGYFQSAEEIADSPSQITLGGPIIPGDLKYFDYNDDGVIDENDVAPIGYSDIPEYIFASQLGLRFKGFSLNMLLQGASNASVMFTGFGGFEFTGSNGNGQATPIHLDRWTPDNPNAGYPSLHTGTTHSNKRVNTFHLRSGNYIRIKNVVFSYDLPQNAVDRLRLKGVRVYVNGDNLFTWSKTGNYDPESLGGSGEIYPVQSVYNLGVNINF